MNTKYSSHSLELQYLCMNVPPLEEVKEFGAAMISLDYNLSGLTKEYIDKVHELGVAV